MTWNAMWNSIGAVALAGALTVLATQAGAIPISNSLTGLAAPAVIIEFDEHLLAPYSQVTNEYADLGVTISPYLYYSPDPTISLPHIGNFAAAINVDPDPTQFSLNFLTNQNQVVFGMGSNVSSWTFEALLDNVLVETFDAIVSFYSFFGFRGIVFDEIRISGEDYMVSADLHLGTAAVVPEPAALSLFGLGLLALAAIRRRPGV